tara:strand:- start:19187 stop:19780 length:594 start_codon:yes stop_codon:yes gene_type:complete
MRRILFVFILLFYVLAHAGNISGECDYNDYDSAAEAENQLKFTVVSTKVGLFSSDVDGYVKHFRYKAEEKDGKLRDMEVTFYAKDMDTDNKSRDEKLHNKCMQYKDYPKLVIHIPGPLVIDAKEHELEGWVMMFGKKKTFKIKMHANEDSGDLDVVAHSTWTLSGMEIPDPSIAVARLSDEIQLNIKLHYNINKESI